jgi:GTP-binding protein YchF
MLSIGIAGLPNVGKSTLFKALTKKQVDISNYPFTTIEPNVGVVGVPDERVEPLSKVAGSPKATPTVIEFIDIAGLVKGAAAGEGLGNKFLAHIREVDANAEVVRVFEDPNDTHVHNKIDPDNDIEIVNTELILADMETINRHLEKTKKDPRAKAEIAALEKAKNGLESGFLAKDIGLDEKESELIKELNLLTNKKIIFVFNVSEQQLKENWQPSVEILGAMNRGDYVVMAATLELLLSESAPEEQKIYLDEIGLKENRLDSLISAAYRTLDLITFFTANENEARAWTAKRGTPVGQAVAAVHTDFEKRFIRAEVINWNELRMYGSWTGARQAGKLRTVGREYIVQEGDVVEVKI